MNYSCIGFNIKKMVFDSKVIVLIKKIVSRSGERYFCVMNSLIQNHNAFIKGGILTIGIAVVLGILDFLFIDRAYFYINIFILIFCWLLISFLLHKISLYKVLALVSLFIATMLVDSYMEVPDNPITFPIVVLFWLGLTYLILPEFFRKYKVAILSVYGAVLAFFFIFRMMPNYLEEHRGNLINLMLIPIPIFTALWVYEQWRWLNILKADKAKAELALLKSQINPHFFFNTLNNLYGLAVEKSEKAPEVILKLSEMMRYTIYEGKEEVVSLRDEINYLENYIELHRIRFRRKVDISFQYEIEEGLKVAPLLFIILLENAFKHGVEKMREEAFIHLKMKSEGKKLFFTIENNFDPSASNQSPGIGLENLKKRLAHSYPNRHELKVDIKESIYKAQLNLEFV